MYPFVSQSLDPFIVCANFYDQKPSNDTIHTIEVGVYLPNEI